MSDSQNRLATNLRMEVVSTIMDTGFHGTAEEYVQKYYSKTFDELTQCEAELMIKILRKRPGCLNET